MINFTDDILVSSKLNINETIIHNNLKFKLVQMMDFTRLFRFLYQLPEKNLQDEILFLKILNHI